MTYHERKPEERDASIRRANAYLEESKRERRANLIVIAVAILCAAAALYGLVDYFGAVIDRDNDKFRQEVGDQMQFQADRSINYYEQLKARKGLK